MLRPAVSINLCKWRERVYNGGEVKRMLGLWIARDGSGQEAEVQALLAEQMIPLEGFVDMPSFAEDSRDAFLRRAIAAIMRGEPLPMQGVLKHLSTLEALPGNVIRKYVFLQLSLLPYLRPDASITELNGCFLLGQNLLVAPLGEDGCIDAQLPDGTWTELATGECMQGRLRRIRGLNAMPILARENSIIPIGVNDRTTTADDADRVTLHWFQPQGEAQCTLADGTTYRLSYKAGRCTAESTSTKAWHVIVHCDGGENFVR